MAKQDVKLLNTKEAAEYLNIGVRTLERWRSATDKDGRPMGPLYVKLHRSTRYRIEDLDEFIKSGLRSSGDDYAA